MSLMPRLLSPSKKLIRYTLSFTPSSLKQVSRDINFNNDLWFILILYSIKRAFIMHKSYHLHSGRKSSKRSRNIENWIWIPNVFRLVCLMSKLEQVDVLIGFCYYIYTWCWATTIFNNMIWKWATHSYHAPAKLSRHKKSIGKVIEFQTHYKSLPTWFFSLICNLYSLASFLSVLQLNLNKKYKLLKS